MIDEETLRKIGPRAVERILHRAPAMDNEPSLATLSDLIEQLIGKGSVDTTGYQRISREDAIKLIWLAANERPEYVLSGRAVDRLLSLAVAQASVEIVAAHLQELQEDTVFFTNLNLDGSYEAVDPKDGGSLYEILVAGFYGGGVVLLYWSEPID